MRKASIFLTNVQAKKLSFSIKFAQIYYCYKTINLFLEKNYSLLRGIFKIMRFTTVKKV